MSTNHGSLSVKGLSHAYRKFGGPEKKVIDGLSFDVQAGKIAVLLGANGSGKTTVLNVIAGLVAPQMGAITLDGRSPTRGDVGYVFQDYRQTLFPWRTVRGNLFLPLEILGLEHAEQESRVRTTLGAMKLDLPLDVYPYQLILLCQTKILASDHVGKYNVMC